MSQLYELQDNKHLYLHQISVYGEDENGDNFNITLDLFNTSKDPINTYLKFDEALSSYSTDVKCIGYDSHNNRAFFRITGLGYGSSEELLTDIEINSISTNTFNNDDSGDIYISEDNQPEFSDNVIKIF